MEINFLTRQLEGKTSIQDNKNISNENSKKDMNFQSIFNEALEKSDSLILESEKLANDMAVGNIDNIHQVLIAGEKADIALQLTLQIRNKILDAYNEIMRMQI